MPRRYYKERRSYRRRRNTNSRRLPNFTSPFRRPRDQMIVLAVVTLIIIILVIIGNVKNKSNNTPSSLLPLPGVGMVYSGERSSSVGQESSLSTGERISAHEPDWALSMGSGEQHLHKLVT
jgi:hypothetical protein